MSNFLRLWLAGCVDIKLECTPSGWILTWEEP